MMGMWFLSSFFGNIMSGYIGTLYENKTLSKAGFFWLLTALGVATGLAIWAFAKPLKKAMAESEEAVEIDHKTHQAIMLDDLPSTPDMQHRRQDDNQ